MYVVYMILQDTEEYVEHSPVYLKWQAIWLAIHWVVDKLKYPE